MAHVAAEDGTQHCGVEVDSVEVDSGRSNMMRKKGLLQQGSRTTLVSTTIVGFKSFQKSEKVLFSNRREKCFVCLCGPNGAGKSSVVESVAFVLGAKARQMREKDMTMLINTELLEKATQNKCEAVAEVRLEFETCRDHEIKTVVVGRSISSKKKAQYFVIDETQRKRLLQYHQFVETLETVLGINVSLMENFITNQVLRFVLFGLLSLVFGRGL
jgi:hypothetical protein